MTMYLLIWAEPSQGTKDSLNVRSTVRVCTLLVPWPWFCWSARHNKATSLTFSARPMALLQLWLWFWFSLMFGEGAFAFIENLINRHGLHLKLGNLHLTCKDLRWWADFGGSLQCPNVDTTCLDAYDVWYKDHVGAFLNTVLITVSINVKIEDPYTSSPPSVLFRI